MDNSTYLLQQNIRETMYGRKHIRERVRDEIITACSKDLADICRQAEDTISEYLYAQHTYKRKQIEANHVIDCIKQGNFTIYDIVLELLCIVIPCEAPQSIQGVAGQLANMFKFEDVFAGIRVAASIIAVSAEAELFDIILASDSETGSVMIVSNLTLSEDVRQYMANVKYQPPMLVPPSMVRSNWGRAHKTYSESMILGADNHHDEPLNLQNLNWANRTALSLDERMLQYEETPKNDEAIDTPAKLENFNRMKVSSAIVYKELINTGNKFYVPIKYDKRGREYTQGYHVSIQGASYKKAIINLHKEEIITC